VDLSEAAAPLLHLRLEHKEMGEVEVLDRWPPPPPPPPL
jgi:hypothetical protein